MTNWLGNLYKYQAYLPGLITVWFRHDDYPQGKDMSLSLPGTDLYYLEADNLEPERFERIIRPHGAWMEICAEYEFDDAGLQTHCVVNMRRRQFSGNTNQRERDGWREKAKLERLVYTGQVVMLASGGAPGDLFYIDDSGKLVCVDPTVFQWDGAERVIREYYRSVSRRDYSRSGGRPQATVRIVRTAAAAPVQRAQSARKPETFGTINSKAAGRLLAAGGIYNQNPEMFAETARKLGGEAATGFDQVLNKQTAGMAIAASSVLLGMSKAGASNILEETQDLQKVLGGAKRAEKFAQNWPEADLNASVNKFAGSNPVVTMTEKGKRIYEHPDTGVQVVEDVSGKYFRIYDPSITGKRAYLDLDGSIPNNKLLDNGSQTGRTQSEYNQVTHFRIKGE